VFTFVFAFAQRERAAARRNPGAPWVGGAETAPRQPPRRRRYVPGTEITPPYV
jgi:hypothetical protein